MKLFLVTALSLTVIALAAHSQELRPMPQPIPPVQQQMPSYSAQPMPMETAPAQQAVVPEAPPTLKAQRQGDVTYITGGAGDEDRQTLASVKSQYNLRLQFALAKSGEFIADVNVTLVDAKGRTVLDAVSDGPYFFAHLAPGRYKLSVTSNGQTQTRNTTVSASGGQAIDFYWNSTT